jgi:hypothetical protein
LIESNKGDKTNSENTQHTTTMKINKIEKGREKRIVQRVEDCFNNALIQEEKNGQNFALL